MTNITSYNSNVCLFVCLFLSLNTIGYICYDAVLKAHHQSCMLELVCVLNSLTGCCCLQHHRLGYEDNRLLKNTSQCLNKASVLISQTSHY